MTIEIRLHPQEWEMVPLRSLATLRVESIDPTEHARLRYVGLEHLTSGDTHINCWGTAQEVKSLKHRFYPGDVLYGKLRPYLDKAALAEWDGISSTDILVLRPSERTVPEFLAFLLHSRPILRHAIATTWGVNLPRTSWAALGEFGVPLPPIPEQHAIARLLSTVQRAKETTEEVIAAARQLKRSLMRHLFTYGPVPVGEAERVPLKETDYGAVLAEWDVAPLDRCAHVQTGVAKGRKLDAAETVVVPYLRVANVQDGYLDLTEIKSIPILKTEIDRYRLRAGDVLLTEGGDFDKLGRGFIWDGQLPDCIHQNHVFAVRTNPKRLLPEYLAYLCQSDYGKAYFLTVAHRTTHLACINATKLKSLPVPLPPIGDQ